MPRRRHHEDYYYERDTRRFSTPSNTILDAATRGHPSRASPGDLIFVDPKVAHIVERSPSPSLRREVTLDDRLVLREKTTRRERDTIGVIEPSWNGNGHANNQLVLRPRARSQERERERERRDYYLENESPRHTNNTLIIRPRSRSRSSSRGRRESFVEELVDNRIDNGDTVIRAKSRPGRRNNYALVRKPKNKSRARKGVTVDEVVIAEGYGSDRERRRGAGRVRRRKSDATGLRRRRRSPSSSSSSSESDNFDRRNVDWRKARVLNVETSKVVSVDEVDGYRDGRAKVYRDGGRSRSRSRGGGRRERFYDDGSSYGGQSQRGGRSRYEGHSPERSVASGRTAGRRVSGAVPVFVASVEEIASRAGGRSERGEDRQNRSVDFGGREEIPRGSVRGSVAGSHYVPSMGGSRRQ